MRFREVNGLRIGNMIYHEGKWSKPIECPHCGVIVDATLNDVQSVRYGEGGSVMIVSMSCTACGMDYVPVYTRESAGVRMEFKHLIPLPRQTEDYAALYELSERFQKYHTQAALAEASGSEELAAIGYRAALECLLKDYEITEREKPREEIVKKRLHDLLTGFEDDVIISGDVVRIMGNDFAHYERRHEEVPFATLKHYYRICLGHIWNLLALRHPPVWR